MKTRILRTQCSRWALLLVISTTWLSCHEKIDTSARYVYKEQTAMSYLEKFPDTYSEYIHLLHITPVSKMSQTTVGELLKTRGHYTVFAPTNQAIYNYLDTLVTEGLIPEPTWDAFTDSVKKDSICKVIVYNSIINSGDQDEAFSSPLFPVVNGGELMRPNMNDHKLTFYYQGSLDSIRIYNKYRVNPRNHDIYVLNGYVHQMEDVIAPKDITASVYLQDIVERQQKGFLTMARAILACGLKDTLNAIRDERYEELYQRRKIPDLTGMTNMGVDFDRSWAPEHRKYGFTIFAETDDFWMEQGIDPADPDLLEKLTRWIQEQGHFAEEDQFVVDQNYTSPQNLLYQWVTYHILPMKLPVDRLVTHYNELGYNYKIPMNYSIAVYEIYTTMGQPRLMKVYQSRESNGIYINRFPNLDNGRNGNYHELSCDMDKEGIRIGTDDSRAVLSDIINCNIYPISRPLSYNDQVRINMKKQRLRFDAQSIFPELTNNDFRQNLSNDDSKRFIYIPSDGIYRYLDNMWLSEDTYMVAISYMGGNPSMNADEMKAGGRYDVTIKLPPVPKSGTYELRYAVLNRPYRGVCQCYFGTDRINRTVTGIPVDMTENIWDAQVGWENETSDPDYNTEVDKRLRNNGYMKGCMSYAPNGAANEAHRINRTYSCERRILIRQHLDPDKTYYLSFKNVLDSFKELYLDYFEWCAKEVYDNPEIQEDIW